MNTVRASMDVESTVTVGREAYIPLATGLLQDILCREINDLLCRSGSRAWVLATRMDYDILELGWVIQFDFMVDGSPATMPFLGGAFCDDIIELCSSWPLRLAWIEEVLMPGIFSDVERLVGC